MFDDKMSDYFDGAAAKYLSAVDASPEKSNQHEIGGLMKAGFGAYLGRPAKGERITFDASMVYIGKTDRNPEIFDDTVTWYDSRHENRGPEFRLYYKSNPVTQCLSEGDFFLIGKLRTGKLILIFTPAGTSIESQLRIIFGIRDVDNHFQKGFLDRTKIHLPLRILLEELGIDLTQKHQEDEKFLEEMHKEFGGIEFPSTEIFSQFSRKLLSENINPTETPDETLIAWMENEEYLFKILERHLVKIKLLEGFGENGDDVNEFISFSLSIQNRRKSRAGHAFEGNLSKIFTENDLKFEQGKGKKYTENKSQPDFLFPDFNSYHDEKFNEEKLCLLGAKTTCKDRWRQVLSEGKRVTQKHLVTLEPAISETQTTEMNDAGLKLIIPIPIHSTYKPSQREQLLSLKGFIDEIKALQK